MPDLLQRAFGALWRLFMTLWMFGDGYIVSAAQFDPVSTFVTPCSWFLCLYILFFPTSSIAARFVPVFDLLDGTHITVLVSVLAVVLFRLLFQRSSLGLLCVVALPILEFCRNQHVAYRARRAADTFQLPEPPQAGAAAAEAEGYEHTTVDAVHEASPAAEQEQPAEPQQSDSADPTDGQPEAGAPESRALGVMKILWSVLRLVVALGALTVVAHFLVDTQLKSWAVNTAPINGTPVFEAEVIIQANQTELPILVPHAEFIPTTTFGSPCQAAPTPTPIAKSTQAWIGTAMSTTMPTPMPTPTPSATPQPEPVPVPIKPNDALNRLFDFELPDPKPVLKWYFSLPTASQYTVIVISLMVLWCLSKPLIILAAHLAVLAIAYFFSAAVIALLLVYGFTAEQSITIALPADFALIASLWWIIFWLKNLAAASNSNAASLSELLCLLHTSLKYIKWGMNDTTELIQRLQDVIGFVNRIITRVNEHDMRFTDHANEIDYLGKRVDRKADLEQTIRILERLDEKIADLETSKGDAPLLREVQKKVDSTRRLAENTRKEKADATELEDVRKELKRMIDLINGMQKTKADHEALTKLAETLDQQTATVAGMLTSQDKLTKDVEELKTNVSIARAETTTALSEASNRYDSSISSVDNRVKELERKFNDHNSQIPNDRKTAKEGIAKIQEENASLKEDVDKLEKHVTDMENRMAAIEAGHGQHKEHMEKLQHDVTDTDEKVNKLRSETDSQHDQATRSHGALQADVDTRFEASNAAFNNLEQEAKSRHNGLGEWMTEAVKKTVDNIEKDFIKQDNDLNNKLVGISARIDAANGTTSNVLQRVEALESQLGGPISQLGEDDSIQRKINDFMDEFMVSKKFQTAVKDTQLMSKKQSKLDQVRAEVRAYAEKRLESKDFQDQIYARFRELQAIDHNLSGDVPEVVPGERASSPSFVPSTSSAASDNTTGNDDPLGDSPGMINGGQAPLPGEMSSDNTTPTIAEESTIPDDVDDHHDSRSSPPGEPHGANLEERATNLAGSTSDGASGDDGNGPRPSGEDDDDTPGPEWQERKEPCDATENEADGPDEGRLLGDFLGRLLAREEWPDKKRCRRKTRKMYAMAKQRAKQQTEPGNLADEQLHDSGNQAQPGGEQDAETDGEKTDDKADDDADDDSDDDDSDDDDPSGPPPGSGGFHGHDGTGGGDDDDEDGDNGGATRPFTGLGASRSAPGLGSSCYAASPTPDSNDSEGQSHANGGDFEPQDDLSNCAEHQSEGDSKKGSPGQQWRTAKYHVKNGIESVRRAMNEAVAESQQQKAQNLSVKEQRRPTEARSKLSTARQNLGNRLSKLEKMQNPVKQAHDHQPEQELLEPEEADDEREAKDLLEESRILQETFQGRGQSTRNQNESGQGGKAHRGGRGRKGRTKNGAPTDETPSPDPQEA